MDNKIHYDILLKYDNGRNSKKELFQINKFLQELDFNNLIYYIISMKDENVIEKSSNYLSLFIYFI